jgi:Arc/MetJ-type ribon-helix-helix transcriptional regulator
MILGKKLKTSVAIDEDLLKWVDSEIKTKRFASRSHAIEYCLQNLKKQK